MCQGKVNNFLFKICLYPYREHQGTSLLLGGGVEIQVPLLACSDPERESSSWLQNGVGVLAPRWSPLTQWSWLSTTYLRHPLRGGRRGSSLLLRGSRSAEASVPPPAPYYYLSGMGALVPYLTFPDPALVRELGCLVQLSRWKPGLPLAFGGMSGGSYWFSCVVWQEQSCC